MEVSHQPSQAVSPDRVPVDDQALPDLTRLEGLYRSALAQEWQTLFGQPPPPKMSQLLLRRFLAHELQIRCKGGLPPALSAELARLVAAVDQRGRVPPPARKPKAGARFLREWNGVTHVVDVTDEGFVWNGHPYRSLTAIARAITGAHWSGPRFFGLIKSSSTLKPVPSPKAPSSRPRAKP